MHNIRLMSQEDIPAVLHVQRECYELLTLEDEATIRARLNTSPDSAWIAEDDDGVCAYLVSYRSVVGKVTPLGGHFEVPSEPDCLYLHDLAISDRSKGSGMGSALVRFALAQARGEGLKYSSLVSVQGSSEFWKRLGFDVFTELDTTQKTNLQSYAGASWYMVKKLTD